MVLTKDNFIRAMKASGEIASKTAIKECSIITSIAVAALSASLTIKMSKLLFDDGLVGQLDMPMHSFTIVYMTAVSTLVTTDPVLMLQPLMSTLFALNTLADIVPDLYAEEASRL